MSETKFFDAAAATELVKELRAIFISGNTRSYEWRVSQLESLLKLCVDHEEDICDALRSDLSKPALESIIHEVFLLALNSFTVLLILVLCLETLQFRDIFCWMCCSINDLLSLFLIV